MRKVLIFLSGVYLILFGAFQLARFWLRYDFIMAMAAGAHRVFLAMNFGVFSFFGLLSIIMGIGLIYRKNWAREMLVVISLFGLFFGVSLIIIYAYLRYMLPYGSLAVIHIEGLYYWSHVVFCLIAAPLFFVVFFTRKSVISFFK